MSCETARITLPNGPYCNSERPILERPLQGQAHHLVPPGLRFTPGPCARRLGQGACNNVSAARQKPMAALHKGGKRTIMKVFVRYYTTNEHLLTYICKRNHKQTNNNKRNEETTKSHTPACRHSHGNSHHAGRRTAARGHRTGGSAFRHAPARAPFVSRPLTEHIENRSQTGQDGHQGHTESHRPHCRAGRGALSLCPKGNGLRAASN